MGLVHLLSGLSRCLFMKASGRVCIAVESFETSDKSTGPDVHSCSVIVEMGRRDQFLEMLYDRVWDICVLCNGHFAKVLQKLLSDIHTPIGAFYLTLHNRKYITQPRRRGLNLCDLSLFPFTSFLSFPFTFIFLNDQQ